MSKRFNNNNCLKYAVHQSIEVNFLLVILLLLELVYKYLNDPAGSEIISSLTSPKSINWRKQKYEKRGRKENI
jgi:hypothetical protein